MSIIHDIRSVNPGSLITLYELDTSEIDANRTGGTYTGISKYYFHNGVNQYGNNVVWQGNNYTKLPVEATGFEMSTKGTLPKPTIRVSNLFMSMTSLIQQKGDLVGAKLTRRRTMHRYLDALNFVSGAILNWKTTGSLINITNNYTATQTSSTAYHSVASSSIMNNSINGGSTYFWEVTIDTLTPTAEIYLGISTGNTSTLVNSVIGVEGRGYSNTGDKWYNNNWYSYGPAFTTGDTIGIVYDSSSGLLYFFKNNISCRFELDGITPAPAFTSVSPIGPINVTNNWNPVITMKGTVAPGATVTANFGASPFKYGIPSNIPNRPPATVMTVYGNVQADPNAHFPDDIYFVNRKSVENNKIVEYELSTALDVQMVKLPRRQIIQNTCLWKYRGEGCNYTGTLYFDANDIPVIPLAQEALPPARDICSKKLSGCKLRFPNRMPFGGFPGAVVR